MSTVSQAPRARGSRREELLRAGARLFADRGFHGTSIEDVGAAVGISGPAVYKHFPSKDALLAAMLVGISERLLEGGRAEVARASGDSDALRRLIAFHTDFALGDPDLIRVQDRDLANLSEGERRRVRRLQRDYVETWVGVLTRLDPGLEPAAARIQAHAVFGLLNSTPYSGRQPGPARDVLESMARQALTANSARATN
ncbi:MAG: TetR family transcriptional regulator [Mycobacterium sp.]|jgi:AcrR family transcriptional regulator|nr:TetR family transcriptional regulator [Mycobacterium sp.]MCW2745611.1 TetR family transcriptional regulator [Mycobacterium sp.]